MLRKSLEPDLASGKDSRFILRKKQTYLLNTEAFRIDADELLELCDRIMEEDKLDPELAGKFVQLYRGGFMSDHPYDDFLSGERERVDRKCMDTLMFIANYYRESSTPARSIEYYERILELDPYDDSIYIDYIDTLLSLRATHKAQDVADKMVRYIEEELGSPSTDILEKLFKEHGFKYDSAS